MDENVEFRLATSKDLSHLEKVGERLFDSPIQRNRAVEFLDDPRHHLVLAFQQESIVGMASGFHYVHPDKDPELFINEVAVLDDFQNGGIGRQLVRFLVAYGKNLGCNQAWVLTEPSNKAAKKAYKAAGGVEGTDPIVLFEFG